MKVSSIRWIALGIALLALALGSPVLADNGAVRSGVDLWTTVEGFAQTSFDLDPIPAGFFCAGSKPFTGTIVYKGSPLAAEPANSLGPIDTVVTRLDDAAFDAKGVAYTRIQLTALSLVSTRPVDTSCGPYDVKVSLVGEQPTTKMRITRTSTKGGTYGAPLSLNVKVTFTPAAGQGEVRELTRRIDLGPAAGSVWAYSTQPRYEGTVRIDTNNDGAVDATLPPASNFLAGVSPVAKAATSTAISTTPVIACPVGTCAYKSCHCNPDKDSWDPYDPGDGCDPTHLHCIWTCVRCGGVETGTGSTGTF